jgi:hypothetical protein
MGGSYLCLCHLHGCLVARYYKWKWYTHSKVSYDREEIMSGANVISSAHLPSGLISFYSQALEEARERCRNRVLQWGMNPKASSNVSLWVSFNVCWNINSGHCPFGTYLESPNDFPMGKEQSNSSTTSRGVFCVLPKQK